jgi:hypothetical protein
MASGGAGVPSPETSDLILAIVEGGTSAAGAFFLSLFPKQESTPSPSNPIALGTLSDPDVFYHYNNSEENRAEDTREVFTIYFSSSPTPSAFAPLNSIPFLGGLEIVIKSPTHLHLDTILSKKKGFGKKFMAILGDIAQRKGIKLITLTASASRVSYYLGLNSPYTIADNADGAKKAKFNAVYTERKTKGNANEAASVAASKNFVTDEYPFVKMTKTLPRKTRRNRRNRTSRRSRRN